MRLPCLSRYFHAIVRDAFRNARDFLYPPLCVLCDTPLSSVDDWLCADCIAKLDANCSNRNACPRCSQNRDRHPCACHLAWDYPFERVFSLFDYDETVQAIARQVKYRGRKALAYHVGKRFAPLIPREIFETADCMTAIPLHFLRKMKRGYNQAERLAKGILAGSSTSLPYLDGVLKRTRHTKTQTKLDKDEREKNLKGAFAVEPKHSDLIRGRKLVLVDDIVTTGATTAHCTRALLEAGVSSVSVLSLARD